MPSIGQKHLHNADQIERARSRANETISILEVAWQEVTSLFSHSGVRE